MASLLLCLWSWVMCLSDRWQVEQCWAQLKMNDKSYIETFTFVIVYITQDSAEKCYSDTVHCIVQYVGVFLYVLKHLVSIFKKKDIGWLWKFHMEVYAVMQNAFFLTPCICVFAHLLNTIFQIWCIVFSKHRELLIYKYQYICAGLSPHFTTWYNLYSS